MFDFEKELMDSVLEMDTELDTQAEDSVYESDIDFTDEMSIAEAAVDVEIAEACKKEACKKEACKKESCKKEACKKEACKKESDGVCEKCGKPIEQCECNN